MFLLQDFLIMSVYCTKKLKKGEKKMTTITLNQPVRLKLQHHLNSLHVYSYMCRLGFSSKKARKAAKVYERIIHPLLYV